MRRCDSCGHESDDEVQLHSASGILSCRDRSACVTRDAKRTGQLRRSLEMLALLQETSRLACQNPSGWPCRDEKEDIPEIVVCVICRIREFLA